MYLTLDWHIKHSTLFTLTPEPTGPFNAQPNTDRIAYNDICELLSHLTSSGNNRWALSIPISSSALVPGFIFGNGISARYGYSDKSTHVSGYRAGIYDVTKTLLRHCEKVPSVLETSHVTIMGLLCVLSDKMFIDIFSLGPESPSRLANDCAMNVFVEPLSRRHMTDSPLINTGNMGIYTVALEAGILPLVPEGWEFPDSPPGVVALPEAFVAEPMWTNLECLLPQPGIEQRKFRLQLRT